MTPSRRSAGVAMVLSLVGSGCGRRPAATETERAASSPSSAQEAPPVSAAAATPPALCEHGVPADLCTQCDPDLIDVFKEKSDWCEKHGVPESHCLKCNPKLDFSKRASPDEAYCGEHGVPEAMCTKCKPQLVTKYIQAGNYCREHGLPESVCPYCHPEVARAAGIEPPGFPAPGTTVRLARPDIAGRAGITTEPAQVESVADAVEAVGQLDFDQNRFARLSARGEAIVSEVKVDLGDPVRVGQTLVVLASAAVGEAQAKRMATDTRVETARAALEREEALLARGISSKREVEDARAALAGAEQERQSALAGLKAAGVSGGSGGVYAITSPIRGVVVTRHAVAGQSALAGDVLIEVADLSSLWAVLEVPEDQAARVRPGQRVTLRFDRGAHPEILARVGRVAAAVDKQTRTVRVRVEVPNPHQSLRAGLFLRARIEVGDGRQAVVVSEDAIQEAEGHKLVFVRTGAGVYEPRSVEIRPASWKRMAVLKGLEPGAQVVVAGAFLLKTEILKDSIGAGCADDH